MAALSDNQAKDVEEARTTQIQLLNGNDKIAAHFVYYYSWFWALCSVIYFFCVTFVTLPTGGQHYADIILGFLLGTAVATIIGYFYGNSSSS